MDGTEDKEIYTRMKKVTSEVPSNIEIEEDTSDIDSDEEFWAFYDA